MSGGGAGPGDPVPRRCWRLSPLNLAIRTWPQLEAPASTVGLVQQGRASSWGWMAPILTPAAASGAFRSPTLTMGAGRGDGLAQAQCQGGRVSVASPSPLQTPRTGFYKLTSHLPLRSYRYLLPWFSNFSVLKISKP